MKAATPQQNERHVLLVLFVCAFFFFGGVWLGDPKIYISYIYCRVNRSSYRRKPEFL